MSGAGSNHQSSELQRAGLPGGPLGWRIWQAAGILSATFIAYAATLKFGFVYDDTVLILGNKSLRAWGYLPGYFTTHIWNSTYPRLLSNAYRPFLLLWLRMNYFLFGVKPWGWHLSIVLAHVAVTYLVFRLALRLSGESSTAAAAALIFGLHPVHVETIAEAAWADQPLSTLFILATLLAWWRSREAGRPAQPVRPVHEDAWMVASIALAAAALLSKESSLVVPLLISALAGIYGLARGGEMGAGDAPAGRFQRLQAALLAGIPYWVVVAIYVPVRIRALKGFSYDVTALPLGRMLLTIPTVLLFYLGKLIWPTGLSCFYDTPYVTSPNWRQFVLPVIVWVVLAAALAYWHRRTRQSAPQEGRAIAFACVWMVLTLIPVLNFRVFPASEIAHDRYAYLPSVGFAVLAAIALRQAASALPNPLRRPVAVLPAALALFVAMGYAAYRQTLYWFDDLTLNSHALQIAPQNVSAMTNLGAALAKRGKDAAAMELYQRALGINPQFWAATVNVGYIYFGREEYQEAARYFVRACSLDPTDGDQFAYLGMTLLRLGKLKEAEGAVRFALLMHPQGRNYHLALSEVLEAEGRQREARQEMETEIAGDPSNWQAKQMLRDLEQRMEPSPSPALENPTPREAPPDLK